MSGAIYSNLSTLRSAAFTLDLSKAAGTYDLCVASGGDLVIVGWSIYCTVVGATFTAATIQTNDTVPFVFLDATDGARANFVAGSNMSPTWFSGAPYPYLRSGKKVQYTITGSTGSGTALCALFYHSLTVGALA